MTAPPPLVLTPVEPGFRRIKVSGISTGHVLAVWSHKGPHHCAWQSYLWRVADSRAGLREDGPRALRLPELKAALEQRLAERGAWWSG